MRLNLYRLLVLPLLSLFAWSLQAEELGTPDRDDIEYPDFDPHTEEEVYLGKVLYFDNRLSRNNDLSCATCHNPDLGFGDGLAGGIGTEDNVLDRNAPHIYNLAWATTFMWDGRFSSLEEQALGPIEAEGEMNMSFGMLTDRLKAVPWYREQFAKIYEDDEITKENVAKAIAAFERTIISDNSPFDRYLAGDKDALLPAAVRGLELFKNKANCTACHSGPNFTDESFHNLGVSDDIGRGKIVQGETLNGAFKTPGLRNTLLTAPYMHDGSLGTLEEVVRFYNQGGGESKYRKSAEIKPLNLTDQEVLDLVAFLGALTDPVVIERPEIPPSE